MTTAIPFELVIAEAGTNVLEDLADKHLQRPKNVTIVKRLNAAIEEASGDILIHTANDIFMRKGWLEALLECFEIPDCGVATLAASDLKHTPTDKIAEGVYGPLFAFEKGFKFDEDYTDIFSDSDLIMRIYESGKRSYRNWNVLITHLYQATYATMYNQEERERKFKEGRDLFIQKHKDSKLLMYRILSEGWVI